MMLFYFGAKLIVATAIRVTAGERILTPHFLFERKKCSFEPLIQDGLVYLFIDV